MCFSRLSDQDFKTTTVNLKYKGIPLNYFIHNPLLKGKQHWASGIAALTPSFSRITEPFSNQCLSSLHSNPLSYASNSIPSFIQHPPPFILIPSLYSFLSPSLTFPSCFTHPSPLHIFPNPLSHSFKPSPYIPSPPSSIPSFFTFQSSPHSSNPSQVLTHTSFSSSPIPISSLYLS